MVVLVAAQLFVLLPEQRWPTLQSGLYRGCHRDHDYHCTNPPSLPSLPDALVIEFQAELGNFCSISGSGSRKVGELFLLDLHCLGSAQVNRSEWRRLYMSFTLKNRMKLVSEWRVAVETVAREPDGYELLGI